VWSVAASDGGRGPKLLIKRSYLRLLITNSWSSALLLWRLITCSERGTDSRAFQKVPRFSRFLY
jgi:hypothetical protein